MRDIASGCMNASPAPTSARTKIIMMKVLTRPVEKVIKLQNPIAEIMITFRLNRSTRTPLNMQKIE